jgi:hypothetical protein
MSTKSTSANEFLILDEHVPDVTRDAGSVRLVEIIKILLSFGFAVTFRSLLPDSPPELGKKLRELGVKLIDCESSFEEQLTSRRETLCAVMVARPEPMWTLMPIIRTHHLRHRGFAFHARSV